jgi:outer membrane protein assembly factor BamB
MTMARWAYTDVVVATQQGGDTTRSQRLARNAAWTAPVFEEDEVAAMVLAGDRLFLAGRNGGLAVLDAADGSQKGEYDLPAPVWDGMIAAGGRLYVTTKEGRVLCLGKSSAAAPTRNY